MTVLPITHSPPSNPALAVEIPHETKRRLGLDDNRSWIVLTEANRFAWPGPDLRLAQPGNLESVAYGLLPRTLFKEVTRQAGRCHRGAAGERGAENRVREKLSLQRFTLFPNPCHALNCAENPS